MTAPVPLRTQLIRLMRWAALFSLAFAIIALVLLARGESEVRAYKFIVTALVVGISVLFGAALLALLFVRRRGDAAGAVKREDHDHRS